MNELNLIDIYRKLHPKTRSFTYESKTINLKSRIDFILVSRPISIEVQNAEIRMSVAPDHKATFLKIDIRSELKRGPGTWKFNNSFLEDDDFKERISFCYPQIHEKYTDVKTLRNSQTGVQYLFLISIINFDLRFGKKNSKTPTEIN